MTKKQIDKANYKSDKQSYQDKMRYKITKAKNNILEQAKEFVKDSHYNNENGSLYLFAQQHELNAYEFDIIKRIVRCRKKGYFHEDLAKSIRVIELYLKEYRNDKETN